jgi:hypothetical protein
MDIGLEKNVANKTNGSHAPVAEVESKANRRHFSKEYKLSILERADRAA